jgi:hypothetical protein
MYLAFITFGLCIAYFFLEHLFNLFFERHLAHVSKRTIGSVITIILSSSVVYLITYLIPNADLSNRFLHMIGGGFLSVMVCFLVVKDSRIHISKFQFFIFSFFIVTALGVGNEIAEFFLQNYFGHIASTSINDTWLDLISNLMGILAGSICFTPFIADTIDKS